MPFGASTRFHGTEREIQIYGVLHDVARVEVVKAPVPALRCFLERHVRHALIAISYRGLFDDLHAAVTTAQLLDEVIPISSVSGADLQQFWPKLRPERLRPIPAPEHRVHEQCATTDALRVDRGGFRRCHGAMHHAHPTVMVCIERFESLALSCVHDFSPYGANR
jgi:hypothetical protein